MPNSGIADIVAVFAQLQQEFTQQHDCGLLVFFHILSAPGIECIILYVCITFCLIIAVYIPVQA